MQEHKGRRLLLHSCCAPCSSGVLYRLIDDFDITVYFYNPNMDTEEEFEKRASEQARFLNEKYGDKIAVGVDIKDNLVAIKGWTETADVTAFDFIEKMTKLGVKTIICTDISKDGAMQGTNHTLYKDLNEKFNVNIIASGGVSSIEDVERLSKLEIHGAIIGKAYYTGAIDLKKAIEVAK